MKAYCPECGIEISTDDIFCGNCGISLTPVVQNVEQFNEQASVGVSDSAGKPASENPQDIFTRAETSEPAVDNWDDSFGKIEKTSESVSTVHPEIENKLNAETPESQNNFEEGGIVPNKNTSENWTMNTESVDLPPLSHDQKAAPLNIDLDSAESAASQIETSGSAAFEGEDNKNFNPLSKETDGAQEKPVESAANPAFNFDFKLEEKEPVKTEPEQNNLPAGSFKDSANESSAESSEPDFQATIPYTPKDFAAQNSLASQIADDKEGVGNVSGSSSVMENAPAAEQFAPIEPPSIPVGSSMHDSLEPTSISVQIYDPKESRTEAEPATLIKSTKGTIGEAKKEESSKEAHAPTSPNIGGTETDGKGKAKLKPLDEGTLLNNRYEIIRKIGGGGMGAVYLASDRNLGGISRAVKEMVQSYIEDSQQEKAVNDFRRESMLLTSLEHPSIPTIFDYFFDEKEARFYLVMKYISGGDLAARLRAASEGRIDETSVTDWAIQIADVLDYLHNRQPPIVYRDLKPSNIMIDGNTGKVMLIDFGIARWVNKEEKGVTAVGTMGYAPPELFSGNVEPRSDIYSLGSTMFHLLTGADPQSNPLLIFDFHKNPRPRQINPQLTDQMEQILMKTVEYSADKRYANAAELRDALVNHLDNLKRGNVTVGVSDSAKANAPAANQLVFCGFCGQKILASDVFCPFCGAQQAVGGQGAKAAVKATAKLMIIGTNELDSPIFNLEKDTNLVGRRDPMSNIFPEVDLSKFDPQTKISRRHARIWRENDSFMVEDLGSSNGTVLISPVNEPQKLAKNQPRILTNGDKIRVGDTTLHFVLG